MLFKIIRALIAAIGKDNFGKYIDEHKRALVCMFNEPNK